MHLEWKMALAITRRRRHAAVGGVSIMKYRYLYVLLGVKVSHDDDGDGAAAHQSGLIDLTTPKVDDDDDEFEGVHEEGCGCATGRDSGTGKAPCSSAASSR